MLPTGAGLAGVDTGGTVVPHQAGGGGGAAQLQAGILAPAGNAGLALLALGVLPAAGAGVAAAGRAAEAPVAGQEAAGRSGPGTAPRPHPAVLRRARLVTLVPVHKREDAAVIGATRAADSHTALHWSRGQRGRGRGSGGDGDGGGWQGVGGGRLCIFS